MCRRRKHPELLVGSFPEIAFYKKEGMNSIFDGIEFRFFFPIQDKMNNIQKRFMLFLLGCIPTRVLFMIISLKMPIRYLPYLGVLALLPAMGFFYLFLSGTRRTGPEVFGSNIWWNPLRPVHGALYLLFAVFALQKKRTAWIFLFTDVLLGLTSFLIYHTIHKNMAKLF